MPRDLDRALLPADLLNKLVWVTLEVEDYEGTLKNKPTFDGYGLYEGESVHSAPQEKEGTVPF